MSEFVQESPSVIQQVDSTKAASELGGPQAVKLDFPDYGSVLSAVLDYQSPDQESHADQTQSLSEAPDVEFEGLGYKSVLAPTKSPSSSKTRKETPVPQSIAGVAQKITDYAKKIGIDPSVALRVARHEGLAPGVWQSNVKKNGIREPSYGPFQLLVGGGNTGFPTGLGNQFVKKTGLNPSDPSTVDKQIEFALDYAKQNGWSAWYGAKAAGVGKFEGIS